MMENKFSKEVTVMLNTSTTMAQKHNRHELTPEFLLLASLTERDSGYELLRRIVG